MKRTNCLLTGVCALALAAAGAHAQNQPAPGGYVTTTRWYLWPGYGGAEPGQPGDIYFNAELGGVLQQDLIVRNAGQKVPFDPGIGGNISVGVDITDALSVELQTGASASDINTSGSTALAFAGNNADIYQIPLLANVIFKAPLPGGLMPYVGAGFGGAVTELEVYQHHFYQSDTDITPAYQAMAGVKFALNRHTQLGVGYRFLGTTAHTWFADNPGAYTPTGPTFSHSIVGTLTISF
jgi:opacity protein-like surface antigen